MLNRPIIHIPDQLTQVKLVLENGNVIGVFSSYPDRVRVIIEDIGHNSIECAEVRQLGEKYGKN